MKFVISTQEMNFLLSKCLNVVSSKATVPILSNLLVEAHNGMLTLTATDLTVGIRCFTEVEVIEEGATTLPAKSLAQLVRELTAANIQVSTSDNEVTEIMADSSRFRLNGMSRNEFPSLPDLDNTMKFNIKQSELKDVLYRTAFAVSREDNRYVLTGVFLSIANGKASFAGTDGKRLSRSFINIDIDPTFTTQLVIPLKAVEEILKNLNGDEEATVYLMPDKIAVETANFILITKLLSGEYPDVTRIIPSSVEHLVSLHREELTTLLRQVSLFTDERNLAARFRFSNGEILLAANTMKIGDGKVSMPANYNGPQLDIAFNPVYFLDALRHSKNETVTMGITDAYNPGIIIDQELSSYSASEANPLFVLMPMRLNEE